MEFRIKSSTRALHLRITVKQDGSIILTKPLRTSIAKANLFLHSHAAWITSVQNQLETKRIRNERLYGPATQLPRLRRGTKEYLQAQREARTRILPLIEELARIGGYAYTTISIRNQKTRWGSCSSKNALSFNYRLIYLTDDELNYLVVHELAHTKHHNHGNEFWAEVEKFVPNYKELRKALKRYRW